MRTSRKLPLLGDPLTDREYDVMVHVAAGKTNVEIAEALYLCQDTVRSHLRRISHKLGVGQRAGMVGTLCRVRGTEDTEFQLSRGMSYVKRIQLGGKYYDATPKMNGGHHLTPLCGTPALFINPPPPCTLKLNHEGKVHVHLSEKLAIKWEAISVDETYCHLMQTGKYDPKDYEL